MMYACMLCGVEHPHDSCQWPLLLNGGLYEYREAWGGVSLRGLTKVSKLISLGAPPPGALVGMDPVGSLESGSAGQPAQLELL